MSIVAETEVESAHASTEETVGELHLRRQAGFLRLKPVQFFVKHLVMLACVIGQWGVSLSAAFGMSVTDDDRGRSVGRGNATVFPDTKSSGQAAFKAGTRAQTASNRLLAVEHPRKVPPTGGLITSPEAVLSPSKLDDLVPVLSYRSRRKPGALRDFDAELGVVASAAIHNVEDALLQVSHPAVID